MSVLKLNDGIYSIGVQNPALRVFDIIMKTEYGTTYNAYLVRGAEKTALIETVHLPFFDEYLENIQSLVSLEQIDYLILNHTEPDHSGSVARLVELCPNIEVLATAPGHKYLSAITNRALNARIAKEGEGLDLGGLSLSFIPAPMLHWPDSMFTWCPEHRTMFTCDFLGAHYCEPRMLDTRVTYPWLYQGAFKGYYDAIFGPFKPYVLAGLDKLDKHPIEMVCTSHGPILTESIEACKAMYRAWSTPKPDTGRKSVLIAYVSAYGCTRKLAEVIADELARQGLEADLFHVLDHEIATIMEALDRADGLLLGSPTINRDALKPIWEIATSIDAISQKGKPAAVFGSYGWSGEGVPMLVERLRSLKLNVVGDGLKVNFVPSDSEQEEARAFARQFAAAL